MSSLASEKRAARKSAGSTAEQPLYGAQRPRIEIVPPGSVSTAGQEAIDLAARAGLRLDPWQQYILRTAMGEDEVGDWTATEVAINLPRQNGKGALIEARVLWGLFIGNEKQILLSAHEFKTVLNARDRIEALIKGCPDLHKRVKAYHRTVGREGVELHDGRELRYIARSSGSGRGFTANTVIFDECMVLDDAAMAALAPTTDAVPNSQLWYLGSAGIGHASVQLGRLRERSLSALETGVPDPTLAYFEWSIDPHVAECVQGCDQHDAVDTVESLLRANPAVGYRLEVEKSLNRRLTLGDTLYARERLGVGEYPATSASTWQVIGEDAWRALADARAKPESPFAFSIDATPERSHAAIVVAGTWRGGTHVEVVEHRPGMDWIVERAQQLQERWGPRCWVVDGGGPAGSLIADLETALGVTVVQPKARQIAQATAQFYDAVAAQAMSHIDQPPLAVALAGAQKRPLGDAWAWARRGEGTDISPLVAATLAKWGLTAEVDEQPDRDILNNVW
ncbi:terminase [Streptomyces sp. NPDC001774]